MAGSSTRIATLRHKSGFLGQLFAENVKQGGWYRLLLTKSGGAPRDAVACYTGVGAFGGLLTLRDIQGEQSIMKRLAVLLALQLLAIAAASGAETPEFRLKHALTLKCSFTASASTVFKDGLRAIGSTKDESESTFSAINIQKGTAKVIGNIRAADVLVRYTQGEIWFIETTPAGNLVITTVFPMYVEGTEDFVVVESRHSMIGTSALGEQASGGCRSI